MPGRSVRRVIDGKASRAAWLLYLGPVVSRRQMDVFHRGYLEGRFSRLAATLPRRCTSATNDIRRKRGRGARDNAGWQIVHHHCGHATISNLAARRQRGRKADQLRGFLVLPDSVTGWQEDLLVAAGFLGAFLLQPGTVAFPCRDPTPRKPLFWFIANSFLTISSRAQKRVFATATA